MKNHRYNPFIFGLLILLLISPIPANAASPSPVKPILRNRLKLLDFANAASPDGKYYTGFHPINIEYIESEKDIARIPGIKGVLPSVVDHSALIPDVGNQGAANSCVCWAAGYYYKTFQDTRELGGNPDDHAISPYFLWDLGGGSFFEFAGELMMGTGAAYLDDYPSYRFGSGNLKSYVTGGNTNLIGYKAFFSHSVYVYAGNYLASVYSNSLSALKTWLASGDCFVIGIPVFNSFFNYKNGVYNPNPKTEPLVGLHALCVVGYNDTYQAFLVVNSWGTGWGQSGYAWLSYDFVRRYVVEAWRFYDSTSFYSNPAHTNYSSYQKVKTDNCAIVYTGPGTMDVDKNGVIITGGGNSDTLKITRNWDAPFPERIPSVISDGSFYKIYSLCPINSINVAGNLQYLTTSGSSIGEIKASQIGQVLMSDKPNSTWNYISWLVHLEDDTDYPPLFTDTQYGPNFNNYSRTEIGTHNPYMDNPSYPLKGNLYLYGVILDALETNQYFNYIVSSSKTYQVSYVPRYLSLASVDIDGDFVGKYIYYLKAIQGNVNFKSWDFSYSLPRIYAYGTFFSTLFGGVRLYFPFTGDIDLHCSSRDSISFMTSLGGNIEGEIGSQGKIGPIKSFYRYLYIPKYYYYGHYYYNLWEPNPRWNILEGRYIFLYPKDDILLREYSGYFNCYMGGFIGDQTRNPLIAKSGWNWDGVYNSSENVNIDYIYGALGIYGIFAAGLDAYNDPYCYRGSILNMVTKYPYSSFPVFTRMIGEGWSNKPIKFTGGDASGFSKPCQD
ncbi:C1 family peptidase [Candidatus Sumerlaeota bacterium]|nr:C1 family peptidase [Candidatus Sumerlaeota bacterium]